MPDEVKAAVYVLWFLLTASDAIGCLIAAVQVFYSKGNGAGNRLAWALLGLAFEAAIAAGSLILWWPTEVLVAPQFAVTRAVGRTVKSFLIWRLVFYMVSTKSKNEVGLLPDKEFGGRSEKK